jgi:hypothetical protein
MDIGINPPLLNSIGLLFDIFGAWLIAIEIFYQFKGKTHQEPTIYCNGTFEQDETPEYKKDKTIKHKAMWLGLALLTVGFVLQIISNHLPGEPYETSTITETSLQQQKTTKTNP